MMKSFVKYESNASAIVAIGFTSVVNFPTNSETEKNITTVSEARIAANNPLEPRRIDEIAVAITVTTSDGINAPRHIWPLELFLFFITLLTNLYYVL
jgi:hypothetical protein